MQRLAFIFLLAVMWCLPGLSMGKAISAAVLEEQISRSASPSLSQQRTRERRQREVEQALDKVRCKNQDEPCIDKYTMTWSDFITKDKELTSSLENNPPSSKENSLSAEDLKAIDEYPSYMIKSRPQYGEESKMVHLLYLTDAYRHNQKTIVNEVERVLRSVRQKNQQAKILLATEFAVATELSLPLRYANTENQNIVMVEFYRQLLDATNQLDIDILALDDFAYKKRKGSLLYKIGQYFLKFDEKNHPDYINNPLNMTKQEKQKLINDIPARDFGIQLRNEQWANYINAVKSYYDIVIVYGGAAHFISAPQLNRQGVPEIVGEKYMLFNFYSNETNKPRCLSGIESKWDGKNAIHLVVESPRTSKDEYIRSLSSSFENIMPIIYQKERVKFFEVLLPDESGND